MLIAVDKQHRKVAMDPGELSSVFAWLWICHVSSIMGINDGVAGSSTPSQASPYTTSVDTDDRKNHR